MTDILRIASAVIAILGIGSLLLYDEIGMTEAQGELVAVAAVVLLAVIFGVRFVNYRQRRAER
ncbi:MAG: hypothetical protein ACLFMX_06285 [Halobacteriales archaeon]